MCTNNSVNLGWPWIYIPCVFTVWLLGLQMYATIFFYLEILIYINKTSLNYLESYNKHVYLLSPKRMGCWNGIVGSVPAAKSDELNFVSRAHAVKVENGLPEDFFWVPHNAMSCTHT